MVYLKSFNLLSEDMELNIIGEDPRRIYNSYYPLNIFTEKHLKKIDFDNITIFYGGNGSGKTTLLNIISNKLEALRKSKINKGNIFDLYVCHCTFDFDHEDPAEIKFISSDDVFDSLLDIRAINAHVNRKKAELAKEWVENKYENKVVDCNNYEALKDKVEARKNTMSKFIRERLSNNNIIEQSNGESALMFWEKEISENAIYILDEPENSLSAENQLKLKQFIEDSARFYNCQFIISTHSPFLLSLKDAKIYDLDDIPVKQKNWTDLSNVKIYYDFFMNNKSYFD